MATAFSRQMKSHRALAGLAIAGGLVLFLWQPFRRLLWQVALAALLTALCLPLQRRLEKRYHRRHAALLSVAGVVMLLVGLMLLAIPQLISRLGELAAQIPGLLNMVQSAWDSLADREWFQALHLDSDLPGTWMREAGNFVAAEAPRLLSKIAGGVDALSRAFLAPVLSYYLLKDRETFAYQISLWIPSRYRKTTLKALREMKRETESYLRGQLMISLAVMGMTCLSLMFLGIPSGLVLGIIMGICEMIPYIGPLIGGIPVVLFALPLGMTRTLWALGTVIAIQQVEGYWLSPRLMAGAVSLHPVYVLLLLSAGGLMGGLVGMMAAIPLFVCARGAIRSVYAEKQPDKLVKIDGIDKV